MAAVDEAIDNAVKTAGDELEKWLPIPRRMTTPRTASPLPVPAVMRGGPGDRYRGDPERSREILSLGRSVARRWEKGEVRLHFSRKGPPGGHQKGQDGATATGTLGAYFALTTVVRALVHHACASDPQLVERIESAINSRHARLQDTSDADREFQDKARRYLSLLTSPLGAAEAKAEAQQLRR